MWRWVVRALDVQSVLDIGCGGGYSTQAFRDLGCNVTPVDGVDTGVEGLVVHDFTTGPMGGPIPADLGWMCEVVEHIEEHYLSNLVPSLRACRVVLMTHAFPGQPGHHHVNCRDSEYWLGFFTGIGFRFDKELTRQTRLMARKNTHPLNHYVRSGMAFRNTQHELLF